MRPFDQIAAAIKPYGAEISVSDGEMTITNPVNGKCIRVYEEEYFTRNLTARYVEYIVEFATQHRHFEDAEDAEAYILSLMNDEELPIEFYRNGKRCFGTDIPAETVRDLTVKTLAAYVGCSEETLSEYAVEIHSWSGSADAGCQSVACLVNKKRG